MLLLYCYSGLYAIIKACVHEHTYILLKYCCCSTFKFLHGICIMLMSFVFLFICKCVYLCLYCTNNPFMMCVYGLFPGYLHAHYFCHTYVHAYTCMHFVYRSYSIFEFELFGTYMYIYAMVVNCVYHL